ncbi:MAG: hypothetical protein GQ574_10620 [Crocinitomix sp.]|nr:hypothetical protein [Crocinitomix sp.]
MAFDGTEGSQITLADGATMTAAHRIANPNAKLGHFMGKDILNQILSQAGCMGIRTYHGLNSNGERELVLVGVDANENDMVSGIVADKANPCPPLPPTLNSLNS